VVLDTSAKGNYPNGPRAKRAAYGFYEAMLGRSVTTLLSIFATLAIVALGSGAPLVLQALHVDVPSTAFVHESDDPTTASSAVPVQPAVAAVNPARPVAPVGFHASWVSQSGPTSLAGDQTATMTVRFRNTGAATWVRGVPGQQANLGVSGEGSELSSNWPSADRVAVQAEPVVPPGSVATFSFAVRAPTVPGGYRLDLRPVIDGTTWMENEGVYVSVNSEGIDARGAAIASMLAPAVLPVFAILVVVTMLFLLLRRVVALGRSRLASAAGR
jgi:hypothetical protein